MMWVVIIDILFLIYTSAFFHLFFFFQNSGKYVFSKGKRKGFIMRKTAYNKYLYSFYVIQQNCTYPNAHYPDRLGPPGKFVKNSTKLTCLEIIGSSTVECYD